ncbi:hypothetical protein VTO73DRAFT_13494 [Trametes versicolor]
MSFSLDVFFSLLLSGRTYERSSMLLMIYDVLACALLRRLSCLLARTPLSPAMHPLPLFYNYIYRCTSRS